MSESRIGFIVSKSDDEKGFGVFITKENEEGIINELAIPLNFREIQKDASGKIIEILDSKTCSLFLKKEEFKNLLDSLVEYFHELSAVAEKDKLILDLKKELVEANKFKIRVLELETKLSFSKELIKLEVERDFYKQKYEELLSK